MSASLTIRDGDPYWWESPDIWVVPGNDPNGAPGQPIAGEPAYLWARVHHSDGEMVRGARINFYWSNPAAGVTRGLSTHVGSSFVDLQQGEGKDVLCVTPWVPVIVNQGHECLVAEVVHPSDPLPSPLPDSFSPPTYRQVAQKNVDILAMAEGMMVMAVQVPGSARTERHLIVTTRIGGTLDHSILKQFGLDHFRPADDALKITLSFDPECTGKDEPQHELQVRVKPGTARAVYLKVWPRVIAPLEYVLVRVISWSGKVMDGGITYVLTGTKEVHP